MHRQKARTSSDGANNELEWGHDPKAEGRVLSNEAAQELGQENHALG
jgi:hypothetical protein